MCNSSIISIKYISIHSAHKHTLEPRHNETKKEREKAMFILTNLQAELLTQG